MSCSKEKTEPAPAEPETGLLHKVKAGSSTTVYYHDAGNKVVRMTQLIPFSDSVSFELIRNSAGELLKVKEDYGSGDVEERLVTYKPGTAEIQHFVHTDGSLKDSNVVTYSGGLVTTEHYVWSEGAQTYNHAARTSYEFQNGNLITLKQYYMGLQQPHRQVAFTYDTKKSPFHFTINDVIVLMMDEAYLKNNLVRSDVSFPTNLSTPYHLTYAHVYNTIDNPASSVVTNHSNSSSYNVQYFYK